MMRPTSPTGRPPLATTTFVLALLLSALLCGGMPAPAVAQTTGGISGTVTNAASGAPLSGVTVYFYNSSGNYAGSASTNTSGVYTRTGLTAGAYYLSTYNSLGYLDERYDNQPCSGGSCYPYTAGTAVNVALGATVSDINFGLVLGGSITGTVTDAGTGLPLANVYVTVYDANGYQIGSGATTNASGVYTKRGLPTGAYYLRTSNSLGYLDELYDNVSCADGCYQYASGTAINVIAGGIRADINFGLVLGGVIAGTVTDASTGAPLSNVSVLAQPLGVGWIGYAVTNAAGQYSVTGLPARAYEVYTQNSAGYLDETYNNVACQSGHCYQPAAGATAVSVVAGATTGNINFGLALGGTIAGTVTDAVTTAPIPNIPVTLHNTTGADVATTTANASGQYAVKGLTTGTYYVRTMTTANYVNEIYADIPCPACSTTSGASIRIPTGATGVPVTAGATSGGVDFALGHSGWISGVVTDAATGAPLGGVVVEASNGQFSREAWTDSSGAYSIGSLVTGTYRVRTSQASHYVNEVYDNVTCPDTSCNGVSGASVSVTTGVGTTGINFGLARGGTITGTVRDANTAAPLGSVGIRVYAAGSKTSPFWGFTNAAGLFTVSGLPTGTYYVRTDGSAGGYVDELFGGAICPFGACSLTSGTPVAVTLGVATSGIDFDLAKGGSVSGTVTDAVTHLAADGEVELGIFSADGTFLDYNYPDSAGAYTISGLPTGTYYARIIYSQFYIRKTYESFPGYGPLPANGTPITVTAPAATSGIDFQLVRGGAIRGTLTGTGTGAQLGEALVYAVLEDGTTVAGVAETDNDGSFIIRGLAPGSYYIRTFNQAGFIDQVYNGIPCLLCDVTAGQLVTVTGTATTSGIDIALAPLPDAPNDLCASATDITTTPFTDVVSTLNASGAPDDPLPSCAWISPTMSKSVWYRFTPSANGTVVIRTTGSTYDTAAAVYTGSCGSVSEVPGGCLCNALPLPYFELPIAAGTLEVPVTGGVTYTILVAATDEAGGTLNFSLDFKPASKPSGDFTGDGKADLLWRHATGGDVWLWPLDGAASTAQTYVRTVGDTTWEIRGVGDFTGDGKSDILWRNTVSGQIYLWPMDGAAPQGDIYVGTVAQAYDIVGTGDFNGDGKTDILWRHTTLGDVWVWLMDGPTPLSEVYVDRVDPAYVVKGVGDLDGNGKADIVWHGAAGDVWVWPMDGTTRLDQVWVANVPDTGYQIQGVADFTGDGQADIVWWHTTRGEVWVWTMDGPARVAETWVATVPETEYRIVGTGDYNGDGQADVLWWHTTRGEVWVWLMNGTTRVSETWMATVPDVGYRIVK